MTRQEYLDQLVALAQAMRTDPSPDAQERQFYLDQIVTFARDIAAERRLGGLTTANIELFSRAIMSSSKDILWRLAGATVERRRSLTTSRRAMLGVLEMSPDLLGPLGDSRVETAHSSLLTHFLDPQSAGDVGLACRDAFVTLLRNPSKEDEESVVPEDLSFRGAVIQSERHLAQYGRVDISIESEQFVLLIEVKIDASERDQQLSDYASALKELCADRGRDGLLVFLTADPKQKPGTKATVRHITFRDVLISWLPVAVAGRTAEHMYLSLYLKTIAHHLYKLAEADNLDDWSLRTQRAALSFLETELEFA